MYVLICFGNGRFNGLYVAKDGTGVSYTKFLQCAKRYNSVESAQLDACGNEYVKKI